jgi:hypothetical protein
VPLAEAKGGVGDVALIMATAARASLVRIAVMSCSSSRSAVVVRSQARAASYLFFTSVAAVIMASSFFQNSVASTAWQSSSVAHQGLVQLIGDAAEGERAVGP